MSFKKMLCMLLSATMIATSVTPALAGEGDPSTSTLPTPILEFDFSEDSVQTSGGKTTVTGTTTVGNKKATAEVVGGVTFRKDAAGNEVATFPNDGLTLRDTGIRYTPSDYYEETYAPGNGYEPSGEVDPMKYLVKNGTYSGTTVVAWVKTTDFANGKNSALFMYGSNTGSSSAKVYLKENSGDSNTAVYYTPESGGVDGDRGKIYMRQNLPTDANDLYVEDVWQMVTLVEETTANGNNKKLFYVDGILRGESTAMDANRNFPEYAKGDENSFYLGYMPTTDSDAHFVGDMDSVAVYDTALTADQIADMYSNDKKITDQNAADAVIKSINAISEFVTGADLNAYKTENKAKIEAARTAYNALSESQQALVPADVLTKLTDAEDLVAEAKVEDVKPELEAAIAAATDVYDPGNEPDATTGDTKWTKDTWEAFVKAYKAAKEAVEGKDASAMITAKLALEKAQAALKEYKNDLVLQFDFKNNVKIDDKTAVVYGTTGSGRTIKAIAHGVEFETDPMLGEEVVKFHKAAKGEVADAGITYDAYNPYDPEEADHVGANLYDPNGNGKPYNPYDPMNELTGNQSTISMWIRTDGNPFSSPLFSYGSLKSNGTDLNGLGASLQIHGRQAGTEEAIFYRDNGGNTSGRKFGTTKASPYFADQWQLMVLVEDGNTKILYANGEVIGRSDNIDRSLKGFATDEYYNDKIYIGYLPFNDEKNQDTHFEGTISTVSVYNRAYSEDEVKAMYMEKGPLLNYRMAEAAYEVIKELPDPYEVTVEDEDKVVAAREAYDKLIYQVQKDWLEGIVEDNEIFKDYEPIATGTAAKIKKAEEMLEIAKAKASLAAAVKEQEDTYEAGLKEGKDDEWTADSWAAYKAAYEAAAKPAGDVKTAEDFKALENALKDAAAALVTKAEIAARAVAKEDLQKAIDEVMAIYDKNNADKEYSSNTWSKFKNAYNAAINMMNDDKAFSDDIIDCKDALLKAKEDLKQSDTGKARAALRAAIEAAKAAYEAGNANNKYTADSWTAFAKAYTDATAIVDVDTSKTKALNDAAKALTDAQAALKTNSNNNNNNNNNNGGTQAPVLTDDEQAIVKELGVTSEVAQAINKVAAEMKIDKATLYITEKDITSVKKNTDIKGTNYAKMQVKVAKQDKKSAKLTWKKVTGADGYIVYGAKADKKAKFKKLTDTTKLNYTQKKLKKGTAYKYIVVAYKNVSGTKVTVAASKTVYTITKGGKYGVAKEIAFKNVKKSKKTLKVKKTFTLKTKETKADKKIKNIVKVRYESSNPKVATVNSKGKIKGIKKGTATIYAYTQNGMVAKVNVTVKK